jgi:hypothetical protein
MKQNKAIKYRHCALKMDMRKAYDRVELEWCYLEAMMLRLVFNVGSVSLVIKIITTVPFSVFFSGTPQESFKPTGGIRKGDPISLYNRVEIEINYHVPDLYGRNRCV